MEQELKELALELKGKFDLSEKSIKAVEAKVAEITANVEKSFEEKKAAIEKAFNDEVTELKSQITKITERADELDALVAKGKKADNKTKSFGEAFGEALEANFDDVQKGLKSQNSSVSLNLKAVGNMLLSANLTGDSVATYSNTQALLPAQKLNFRDLVPSVMSDTGTYVQYRETGSEGSISAQTEGSSKSQIDYDLTEVKTVNSYIAGYATFSKQYMKSLPFMQGTLTRLLLRDFFKAENASFFSTVSGAATGTTTMTATNDVEQIVELIANTKNANYNASYALVSPSQMARLIIATFAKGYYAGAGAIILNGAGGVTIWGIPVFEASWVTDDKVLIIDRDYLERVEVEGLNVTFSYENGTNFVQNLVTARIECYEAINLMMPASAIYADLGNVA